MLRHFGTRLRTCSLKTIINRFLYALSPLRLQVPSIYFSKQKKSTKVLFFVLVRVMGLEPIRRRHTPLKRACLPVPAHSHIQLSLNTFNSIAEKKHIVNTFIKKNHYFLKKYGGNLTTAPKCLSFNYSAVHMKPLTGFHYI